MKLISFLVTAVIALSLLSCREREQSADADLQTEMQMQSRHIDIKPIDIIIGKPLYILDGYEITREQLDVIGTNPEHIESITVLKNISSVIQYGYKGKNGVIIVELKDEPIYGVDGKMPDEWPMFPGGDRALFEWLEKEFRFPKELLDNSLVGTLTIKLIVEKDGSIGNIEIVSSPHQLLSDEAVRMMKSSPRWTPGKKNGEPIRVYYHIPIPYRFDNTRYESKDTERIYDVAQQMPQFPGGDAELLKYLRDNATHLGTRLKATSGRKKFRPLFLFI
jgi:protein TonB